MLSIAIVKQPLNPIYPVSIKAFLLCYLFNL